MAHVGLASRKSAKISSCGQVSTNAETWYAKYTLRAIYELHRSLVTHAASGRRESSYYCGLSPALLYLPSVVFFRWA